MGFTEATIQQVKDFVGTDGVELAKYLRARYAEIGRDIQDTHLDVEGYRMDLVEGYGGRVRRAGIQSSPDDPMFSTEEGGGRASVKSASMKERTGNVNPIKFGNAMNDFLRHMQEANHYLSHAELTKKFNMTFGNNTDSSLAVRRAIRQKLGDNFLAELDHRIERIVGGQFEQISRIDRALNKFRAGFTKAKLAIKPVILIKQLSSAPSFVEEIGFKDYGVYFGKFLKSPIKQWGDCLKPITSRIVLRIRSISTYSKN